MKTIQEILEDRRRKNEIDLESRRAEVEKKAPDIIKLENDIKRKNIERIQALLEKKDTDILTAQVEKLSKMKFSLLEENKFPVDYLEMKYHCDICKDTGAVGTKRCKCTEALKVEKLYENSELKGSIEYENFEKFDLSKFRKSRQEGELISPYENMKDLRDEMLEYSENFTRDSVNLYLFGPVGTGKTFMINCIAKKLMDDGFSLVYLSEADLVNLVLEHRFAYSQYKQG